MVKVLLKNLLILPKIPFGVTFSKESFTFQLKLLIEQIKFIDNQVKECETKIKRTYGKINSPITTIPGIGPVLGAVIISEFGDISRFDKPSKLSCFMLVLMLQFLNLVNLKVAS